MWVELRAGTVNCVALHAISQLPTALCHCSDTRIDMTCIGHAWREGSRVVLLVM